MSGARSYYAGLAAEDAVARDYEARGAAIEKCRWRSAGGEIDLIVREGNDIVFVEVKQAKDFSRAAQRISKKQLQRLYTAANDFLSREPMGSLTPARFDVALVNAHGETEIMENALAY